MDDVLGTQGYEESLDSFVKASLPLDFAEINEEFLSFLPNTPALVLDLGAGVGQNAYSLASLGYQVIAVEPLLAFLTIAEQEHKHSQITWIQDSLPNVKKLSEFSSSFQFILLDGVWHHIHPSKRMAALSNIKSLLHPNGHCAISLRNGPAGAGKYVFPTSTEEMLELSELNGLECQIITEEQPSKLKNKEDVNWSKVVLKRRRCNAV